MGNTGLNVVIDGLSVMHQFVKTVVADNLIQLSLISHRQNADKWKIFIKFLKGTEHYHCGNEKCFRTHTLLLYDIGGKSIGTQTKSVWYSEAQQRHPKRLEDEEAQ